VVNAITEEPDPLIATPNKPEAQASGPVHSGNQLLAVRLMQLVME